MAGLLLAALASFGEADPAQARARPTGLLVPEKGALFGAHVQYGILNLGAQVAVERLETQIGRRLDIDHYYTSWKSPFPGWREAWDISSGRIPFISWAKTSTSAVNSGKYDAMIRARAVGLKALGKTVFLEWFWEMDGARNRSYAKSPASFISAWKRTHKIFEKERVDNVAWVWCPNASGFLTGEAPKWYPGDDYVDWICADGYNWAPGRSDDDWRSFVSIFQPFYDWASTRSKPLLVGEYGVQERGRGEKAQWFEEARAALKDNFPNILGIVYFNADLLYDWRVNTSKASLEAFRGMGLDRYFSP
ncbi:MAG: glycoside hydrolase family 26 protein [Acidimicrobiia bacterium]